MLSHDVFFTLRDSSPEAIERLAASCHEHLRDHPGVLFFSVGGRDESFDRDVNDLDFHVALHAVFTDNASHDAYQESPVHAVFIDKNEANWASVRVFDSRVEGGSGRSG